MACLWTYHPARNRHAQVLPCEIVRVGPNRVQVETVRRGRLVRAWVEPSSLTPDPERRHELWPVYEEQMRAARSREALR